MLPPELTGPADAIAKLLVEQGATVTVAESSAGGLVSASLLAVPGASAYYLGGTVIYTVAASKALVSGVLELPQGTRGATEGWAAYLAQAVRGKIGATWGVSETGATGPS